MKQPSADILEMEHAIGYSGRIPRSVILHPNGVEFICIAGASLIITDLRDAHKQSFLQGHDDQITCLAVSNRGELVASGQKGDNSDVIIWDYHRKIQKYRLSEHDYEVVCVDFSHDDRLLFSSGNPMDKRIFIWDCQTGYIVGSVNHTPEPTTIARWGGFAKDIKGRDTPKYQFATSGNKQICLWKLDPKLGVFEKEIINTGNLVRDYICMEFSKNREEYLLLGTTSGDFCVFQMKNKFFSHQIVVAALGVMSIRFVDFTRFIVGAGNGTLAMYQITEDNKINQLHKTDLGGAVNSITVRVDGLESLISTDRGLIFRFNTNSFQKGLHSENHTGSILDMSYPPGVSDRFASASEDGTIRLWDISEYYVIAKCQANVNVVPLSLVYRDEVLLSGWADGKIRMFRSDNGQQIWQIDNAHKTGVTTLCISNNLKFFCSGGGEGDVRVWEMRTREMVSHLKEHTHKVTKVKLIANETQLLTSSRDRALLQWDLKTEKRVSAHIQRMGGINSFDTVPNTSVVFSTGQDRKISLWDLNQSEVQRQFETSGNPKKGDECYSICLSPNFKYAVTGGSNCSVKLWDLQTGQQISEGFGHSGPVNTVQFAPDGKQVISGAQDGVVIVWNVFL
ncbi:unnamed protein product [Paramecium octaurelia]|uniref:Uncharacterized protein n=1 Tax=Paramecium octaurelia TaxID=43137 RepID=A0A8S1WMJ1_PAROT|nr:unnamed protein product [Paramecium octaurelia]